MRVALVHDYLNEFGGAERVLLALSEIWPKAPIYTAFYRKGSSAYERFKNKDIRTSWAQKVPLFSRYLHSPLRFLAPLIWDSFDFSNFDVVIGSSSWYVTKGFKKRNPSTPLRLPIDSTSTRYARSGSLRIAQGRSGSQRTVEVCYCHTSPRYLYGYKTSVDWQRYWPVKVYALLVNHFLRVYDFEAAQRVDWFIANSKEVQARIKKFYRRDSVVIYPPVDVNRLSLLVNWVKKKNPMNDLRLTMNSYFLVVSRLVASKNVDVAVEVYAKLGLPLKVVGAGRELENLKKLAGITSNLADRSKKVKNDVELKLDKHSRSEVRESLGEHSGSEDRSTIEFLGEVSDEELIRLYQNCRAVIFAASQEDFGLVPVEAMAAGKPVIVNAEGGVLESVIDWTAGRGKCTGVYFNPPTAGSLTLAINNFIDLERRGYFDPKFIRAHAQKFSIERFKREILKFVESKVE